MQVDHLRQWLVEARKLEAATAMGTTKGAEMGADTEIEMESPAPSH